MDIILDTCYTTHTPKVPSFLRPCYSPSSLTLKAPFKDPQLLACHLFKPRCHDVNAKLSRAKWKPRFGLPTCVTLFPRFSLPSLFSGGLSSCRHFCLPFPRYNRPRSERGAHHLGCKSVYDKDSNASLLVELAHFIREVRPWKLPTAPLAAPPISMDEDTPFFTHPSTSLPHATICRHSTALSVGCQDLVIHHAHDQLT